MDVGAGWALREGRFLPGELWQGKSWTGEGFC